MVHPSGSIVLLVVVHTGRRNNGWNNGWNKNRTPHELLLSRGQLNYNKATCAVDTSQIVVRTVRTISTVQWWCRIVHSCWWSKSETNYRILVPTAYPRCELCSSVPRDESDQHTVRCARLGSAVSPLPTVLVRPHCGCSSEFSGPAALSKSGHRSSGNRSRQKWHQFDLELVWLRRNQRYHAFCCGQTMASLFRCGLVRGSTVSPPES